MDWIFDNIQVFLVIAIAVGSLVKKFLEARAEEREARRRMDESPEEVFGPDEEWQVPVPVPRQLPPPLDRPVARPVAMPPPLRQPEPDGAEVLRRQREMEERLRQARQEKEARKKDKEAAARAAAAGSRKAAVPVGLRATLHQRGALRRAFLVREVLGPPQALR